MIFEKVPTGGFIYRYEASDYEKKPETKVAKAKVTKTATFKMPKAGSKQAEAVELYKKNKGDRKATIVDIMNVLGMSRAGATTYAYNAMKIVAAK